jgi:hypothetical protein
MACSIKSFALEEGAADQETKVFGIWTPREFSHHLRAGSEGPEATMTSTRYELEKIVLEVQFEGTETYTAEGTAATPAPTVATPTTSAHLQQLQAELAGV